MDKETATKKTETKKTDERTAAYERPQLKSHGSIEAWTRKGGGSGDGTKRT